MLAVILIRSLSKSAASLIQQLNLPTTSQGWIRIGSPGCELNESLIHRASEAFRYPLNPDRHLIISMRWTSIEDQISHLIFGAALAYALNRTILVEMRRYPLSKPQPNFLFPFRNLTPALIDPPFFSRLRIDREFYCKSQTDFEPHSSPIPLLLRNFDDVSALYGNHFIGRRLRDLFGFHASFFLSHHFIDLSAVAPTSKRPIIGIDARSFVLSRRMPHLRKSSLIGANFTSAIHRIVNPLNYRIWLVTNATKIAAFIQNKFEHVTVISDDGIGLAKLIAAKVFIGTYRSKLSLHVNSMRARPGWLLNTDNGDLLEMSNSQAGVLSPYVEDVEDIEFTVNERLRGCKDNIDDLRDVLQTFVL
jgi:hypothetical protein